MLMFPVSEQSYCSTKYRELFPVLLLVMEMEKKPWAGSEGSLMRAQLCIQQKTLACVV